MRPWTTAAMRGALLTLVSVLAGACDLGREARDSTAGESAVSIAAQQDAPSLRLVVGDTFRLDFSDPDSQPGDARPRGPAPRPTSSQSSVASVTADGVIRAVRVGRVDIIVPASGRGPRTVIPVQVVTRLQAINMMVAEVCPNVEARALGSQSMSDSVETIHEYHDCQRLIANGQYQGLVGIFAHANVARYEDRADWAQGRLAAIIVNFGAKSQQVPYPSLGIGWGVNCLVLKSDSAGGWRAAVDSTRSMESRCNEAVTWAGLPASATQLTVREQAGVDLKGDPISPPVARWDWDPAHLLNYIGVKCGARTWCEIGPEGFVQSPQLRLRDLAGPPPPQNGNAYVIKGYYDRQFLSDSLGKQPSTVIGTIWPGEDARTREDMVNPLKWHEVARLEFRDTAAQQSGDYRRYLRNYKRQSSVPPNERWTTTSYRLKRKLHFDPQKRYKGKFNGLDLAIDGVVMRSHAGILHEGPPVVRWRWHAEDERTWTYCHPDGCCENQKVLMQ